MHKRTRGNKKMTAINMIKSVNSLDAASKTQRL
jgi:hypothetical protein